MKTNPSLLRKVVRTLGLIVGLALPLAWTGDVLAVDAVQSGAALINLPAATARLQRAVEDYLQLAARGSGAEAVDKAFSDLRYWSRIVANGQNARRLQADKEAAGASLPAAQRQRGQDVAQQLKQRSQQMEALARQLTTAAAAKDAAATQPLCQKLLELLKPAGAAGAPAHLPLKPNSHAQLPNKGLWQGPGTSLAQLNEHLYGPVKLVAAGSLSGLLLDEAADLAQPAAADLAFDSLTQPDAAIVARVAELGANPVRIQNWVRNNVRFVPGWGGAQNATTTHAQRQGNAYDIATLLVSMLRQAQVPARYVYGTIEVSAANVQGWTGTDVASAAQLLSKARVPARVTAAQTLQLEHVWVEAWVPGTPSRGAVRLAGDSWWPLDASFKTETQTAGLDLATQLGLNAAGVLDAAQSGANCTSSYSAQLNSAALSAAYTQYKQRATTQLGSLAAGAQVGDVLGRRQIVAENYGVLLGTQPYNVLVRTTGLAALPDALRWHLRLRLAVPGQAQPVIDVNRDLAALQGRRLTLAFVPETADDAATLAAQLPRNGLPLDIPAYLAKVKAELRLDGQLLASGGSFTLGQALSLQTDLGAANGGLDGSGTGVVLAGELHAWAFDAHGQGSGGLEAQAQPLTDLSNLIAGNQAGSLGRNDAAGIALTGLAQAYVGTLDASSKLFQRASGMREFRLPSVVRAASRLEAVTEFGLVTRVKAAGVAVIVDRLASASAASSGGASAGKTASAYSQQSLERGNAAAHRLLEQTFGAVDAAHSAVRDIARANALGQRIYRLDASNSATALAGLNYGADVKAAIAQATANGLAVLVSQDVVDAAGLQQIPIIAQEPLSDPSSTGNGSYIVEDVQSPWAAGAAHIAGGTAAGLGWAGLLDSTGASALLAQPLQRIGQSLNTSRTVLGEADGLSWSGFVASDEVLDGVFAAALNRASTDTACDWVGSVLASQIGGGLPLTSRVNHAPEITSAPVTYAASGSVYSYAVVARDADGDPLHYRLAGASGSLPSGLAVSTSGLVSWTSAVPGSYALVVQVDDGTATVEQRYTLVVGSDPAPLSLSAALSPNIADAGQAVNLSALASGGNGGAITLTATLDGVPLSLTPQGVSSFTAPAAGTHKVTVTAQGAPVNGATPAPQIRELVLTVRDPSDTTPPAAAITSPASDTEVAKPVTVTGTATDEHFAYYQLLIRPSGASDSAWVEIARGLSPVSNGALGQLDPTRLTNGAYDLGLRVVDVNGQQTGVVVPIEVARDLKLGQFKLSFTDISVDAAGMPLKLTRTYDSSKRDVKGDFGWGWSATANDVTIRKNMALGLQWQVTQPPGTFSICYSPVGHRRVTVSMPDGGVYRFEAHNADACAFGTMPPLNVVLDGLPLSVGAGAGSGAATAKLEVVVTQLLYPAGNGILDADTGEVWNPTDFKFTSPNGFVYYLREGVGVLQVTDPYGNVVSYGANGYLNQASNVGLQFQRDAQGRITKATDPAGNSLTYSYNAAGELVSVTDRVGRTTSFTYGVTSRQSEYGTVNNQHLLTSITDPSGKVVMQNQFDEYGRIAASADANGQQRTQSFDPANNQIRTTDRRGNPTTYTFDAAGNVTQVVDALGGVTKLTYDAVGNELTRTDPLGRTTTSTYDPATGKLLTQSDPLGRTVKTTYQGGTPSTQQNARTVTDARGNVTNIGFDGGENIPAAVPTQIDEPLGRTTRAGIDMNGNLRSVNVAGIPRILDYDAQKRLIKQTDGLGNSISLTLDNNGNTLTSSNKRTVGGVVRTETTTNVYDGENRLTQETDASGAVRKYTYNAAGKLETSTDALGRVTRFAYDGNARLVRTDYPDGSSEAMGYDADGNVTSHTTRSGQTTRMEYDALSRLVRTIAPDGGVEQREYDAAGQLTAVIDALGARRSSEYDAAGQLIASIDASGRRTEYQYDPNGNLTQVKLADGTITGYTYDALNRLTETQFPDGSKRSTTFRPDKRKQTDTDVRGTTTTFGYDGAGQLTNAVQTGVGQATSFGYDEAHAKVQQADALGHKVNWTYDAVGRPLSRTLPDGSSESFQYDQEGRVLVHTTFGGQRIQSTYDGQGRELTRVIQGTATAPARAIQWTYDAEGRRLTQIESGASSSNGTTSYRYDANGQLVEQNGPQGKLNWAYDAAGNITQRTTPEGTTNYAYDGDGRLTQLTAPDGRTTSYTYDAAGRQSRSVQQLGGGIDLVTERRYDTQGRPTVVAHLKRSGGSISLMAGQRIVRSVGSTVNRLETFGPSAGFDVSTAQFSGNPDRVQAFGYDTNARLSQENEYKGAELSAWLADNSKPATRSTTYAYDEVGNRKGKTVVTAAGTETTSYGYDVNDRLSTETLTTTTGSQVLTTYGWDANGNLASKSSPGQYMGYTFDADNRLVEVKKGASQAAAVSVAQYGYDADGQRIRKTTSTDSTYYLIDPTADFAQVALEKTVSGTATQSTAFIWGNELRLQTRGGQGALFGDSAEALVPLTGHLQSILATGDRTGAVIETSAFDVFGDGIASNAKLRHQFAGEYWDAAADLQYSRARWYTPHSGAFLSPDPASGQLDQPKSLQRYVYAQGDPVHNVDPGGATTMGELNVVLNSEDEGGLAAQAAVREAFAKCGCDLGAAIAAEALNQGFVYILLDVSTGGLYGGQTTGTVEARLKKHIDEAVRAGKNLWKTEAQIIAKFPIPGGKQALDKAEQLIIDIIRTTGRKFLNGRNQIGPKNPVENLLPDYKQFKKILCPKL